jgi:hypothetical protein
MSTTKTLAALLAASLLSAAGMANAGWLDNLLEKVQGVEKTPAGQAAVSALTDDEVVRGLKEALAQGTRQAVSELGRDGGYLDNAKVRIPMPDKLQKVDKLLRTLGQGRYADEFVATLNHAAEKAVPQAAGIFADSVSKMSLDDARDILRGGDDAATRYFRKTSETRLRESFLPLVRTATDQAGVTSAYKKLMKRAGPYAAYLGEDATDLDGYVTGKALDGLFRMVAEEEARIRRDPAARTTDLLKKVFGSLSKQGQ